MNPTEGEPGIEAALVVIAVTLAGLYLASVGPYWSISPDSATYVGWAKSLAAGHWPGAEMITPPVTSLIFGGVLRFFPTGYSALNALTPFLILLALAAGFVLLRSWSGRGEALAVVVLSLASTQLYKATTQLLSEPAYMLFSIAALLAIELPARHGADNADGRGDFGRGRGRVFLAGSLLLLAAMTRTIGAALALAVLVVEGIAAARRQRRPRWVLVVFALLALTGIALWDAYTGQRYAAGFFRMFVVNDQWAPESGSLSLPQLLSRMRGNIGTLPGIGALLLNRLSTGYRAPDFVLQLAGTLAFAWGLVASLRKRVTVTAVYVAIYAAAVAAHMLVGGYNDLRFLIPIVPFVFYYTLEAARQLFRHATRRPAPRWTATSLRVAGLITAACYIAVGISQATRGVREAHYSPFGDYAVKRPGNYDAERLALWLKRYSAPGDRYASAQRDMFDVISERHGYEILAVQTTPRDAFVSWLQRSQVRYLLVDLTGAAVGDSLAAITRAYPAVFRQLFGLPGASLYEVAADPVARHPLVPDAPR